MQYPDRFAEQHFNMFVIFCHFSFPVVGQSHTMIGNIIYIITVHRQLVQGVGYPSHVVASLVTHSVASRLG